DLNFFNNIKPYVPTAAKYFECGDPFFDVNQIHEFQNTHIAENFVDGVVTDNVVERWSMPTRFGARYGKELKELLNLTIIEGYEAKEFGKIDQYGKVKSLKIKDIRNHSVSEVYAENFVIAAGGQESTRLLLRNQHLFGNLDEVPPALGRYYQGHLVGKIASIIFNGDPKKTDF